jgi:hypothetical protein
MERYGVIGSHYKSSAPICGCLEAEQAVTRANQGSGENVGLIGALRRVCNAHLRRGASNVLAKWRSGQPKSPSSWRRIMSLCSIQYELSPMGNSPSTSANVATCDLCRGRNSSSSGACSDRHDLTLGSRRFGGVCRHFSLGILSRVRLRGIAWTLISRGIPSLFIIDRLSFHENPQERNSDVRFLGVRPRPRGIDVIPSVRVTCGATSGPLVWRRAARLSGIRIWRAISGSSDPLGGRTYVDTQIRT